MALSIVYLTGTLLRRKCSSCAPSLAVEPCACTQFTYNFTNIHSMIANSSLLLSSLSLSTTTHYNYHDVIELIEVGVTMLVTHTLRCCRQPYEQLEVRVGAERGRNSSPGVRATAPSTHSRHHRRSSATS